MESRRDEVNSRATIHGLQPVAFLGFASLVRNSAFAPWSSSLRLSAGRPSEANAE